MKKSIIFFLMMFSVVSVSAAACDLRVSLLNQDPYPAVPGDYVKLVFQLEGLESPDCGDITFDFLEDYPIKFNPGETGERKFKKVDYIKDFESNILIPYEVRVDENALDGISPIEANFQNKGEAVLSKTFDLEIEDVRADFEVYIKDYNYKTRELTIEVLNIEDVGIEALTIEIPKQSNIEVKGSNRVVVGDLDSNEYSSADFEAIVYEGDITINLVYSDAINIRRTIEKTITFDSSYFTGRIADKKSNPTGTYIAGGVVVLIIIYYFYNRRKKRKEKEKRLKGHQ